MGIIVDLIIVGILVIAILIFIVVKRKARNNNAF